MIFPTIRTKDLNGRSLTLPRDFEGEFNLLLLAYQRWQQQQVDGWLPFARQLERVHPGFHHYELPVVGPMNRIGRFFLDEGMRSGIREEEMRARVLTLYVDKAPLNRQLWISSEQEITALLVQRNGAIRWRAAGAWTPDKGAALQGNLRAFADLSVDAPLAVLPVG